MHLHVTGRNAKWFLSCGEGMGGSSKGLIKLPHDQEILLQGRHLIKLKTVNK
jgi:hypothetical protein